MARTIWIYAEQADGRIASSYYELLGKAKAVHDGIGMETELVAVTVGSSDVTAELAASGAGKVISICEERLAEYQPEQYIGALTGTIREYEPEVVLFPASSTGSEIAPSVAARLGTGLVAHCAELRADADGKLHMLVPAFGGKLMADNTIPEARPLMVSIKPGVFDRVSIPACENAEVISYDAAAVLDTESSISFVSREVTERDEIPVEEADIVVCAGLGSAVSGNLDKVKNFASKIGASVGYTRPLSDLGYYPDESQMIGTSGKTIKPRLYIGFGNSGAGQHICGIKDSGIIINVNNDDEAQCFDISDYKVTGDCGALLDELLAQL